MTTTVAVMFVIVLVCIALTTACIIILLRWVTTLSGDVRLLMDRAAREIQKSEIRRRSA